MAYHPPTRTKYGDELTDDTWDNKPQQFGGNLYSDERNRTMNYQRPQGQLPITNYQAQPQPPETAVDQPISLSSLTRNLTPEDILFTRQMQRDSFYYRCLPCSTLAVGIVYARNTMKQLPHKLFPYAAASMLGFSFGKLLFQGEFRKRLAETHLNTPYIRELRRVMGVQPIYQFNEFSTSNDFTADPQRELNNFDTSFDRRSISGQWNPPDPAFQSNVADSNENEPRKASVSYEELRARNRGVIR